MKIHPFIPALLLTVAGATLSPAAQSPNIIFILADDLGWNATSVDMDPSVSYSKSDYYQTPNLERLAAEGMRFNQAYSAAPICTPSRRSIHYGMTPARQHGERFPSTFNLLEHESIPQALKKIDPRYATALFGKWGSQMGAAPAEIGYDESDGPTDNWVGGMTLPHPENQILYRIKDDPKQSFGIARRAVSFIERCTKQNKPFFLNVSFYAVHRDVECRMDTLQKYKGHRGKYHFNEAYAAMIDDMDAAIGEILDAVKTQGIEDSTYIFFTSDNGGESGCGIGDFSTNSLKQADSLNYPLKNGKQSLFEGGLRVPFIAAGPGIAKDSVCGIAFAGWDLFPTFVELAGGTAADLPKDIDGHGITNALLSQRPLPAITESLVFNSPYTNGMKMSVLVDGQYKLIQCWDTGAVYLIDLKKDISETTDVSEQHPEITRQLTQEMEGYFQKVHADIPVQKK